MKKVKTKFFIVIFFVLTIALNGQDQNNKWAIGVGSGALLYSKNGPDIGYRFTEQFPRISVARYLFKNISIAGAYSQSLDANKKYTTFDGEVRYDFGTSENLIQIYALIGGSLIDTKHLLPLANFGAGGALWFSEKFGLYGRLTYKYNHIGFNSQDSHIYAAGGVIYRFSISAGSYQKNKRIRKDTSRKRIWEMKH